MSGVLDLALTLTAPPTGAPENVLASVTLRCEALGLRADEPRPLIDPLTDKERNLLRWYLEEYWQWPYDEFAERGGQVVALLPELGKRLYRAAFSGADAVSTLQAWRLAPAEQRRVSIVGDVPAVLSLPWELLHDEQGFLALRARRPVSIVRRLSQRELAAFPTPFTPPLRVLLVTPRPEGAGFFDPRGVARELLDEMEGQVAAGTVAIEILRPPTLPALRARLRDTKRPPIDVLHFDGHGAFDERVHREDGLVAGGARQGELAFEDGDQGLDRVPADRLAQVLHDSGVQLAVLTACQSALGSAEDVFSSVAARLVQGGVDAVVAMSASLLTASAARYAEGFYGALAAGAPAPIAHERARQALHDDPRRHVHRRRADEPGRPVELHDWWLPHFYQQRPLALQPPASPSPSAEPQAQPAPSRRLSESMPAAPRYRFGGRARELLFVERRLGRGQLVVVHGFGGAGKTALAREAAEWLTRTGMYDLALCVSFEHGGDASGLLSELGKELGIYDGAYTPGDPKAALEQIQPALTRRPALVIADNLESLLPGGDAPLDPAARAQLWGVLLELARLGAGVLLTSRTAAFGDGRLAPGEHVAHLPLAGLLPDDAYALASRLLGYLGIDRARAPYAELRDLLGQLDHHPLATQLVLPALRDLPLAAIGADFAALLPRFADDAEHGRNRSLLASLEYSLRRLSDAQRALLPRLALFDGGAMEPEILAVTEIPEADWAELRPALEQAALLTAERVHEAIAVPFLRFHPVLAPYLRGRPGADDPSLRERYAARYLALARALYHEDTRNPEPVRALVRRELPNLRRALDVLLELGELDAATDLADRIAWFLRAFGLARERDELHRRVAEALATAGRQAGGTLTRSEYLSESNSGEAERGRGDLHAAFARFTALLARIVALPAGTLLGRGSYEHCLALHWLARCLSTGAQPASAEARLREALAVVEALLAEQPEQRVLVRERGALFTDLGDVLRDQGKYPQARVAYEESLRLKREIADPRSQAVVQGQLGTLALLQRDYDEARERYKTALLLFRGLGEPLAEAAVWHQLGMVAAKQGEWEQAERCYRESLAIEERLGNAVGACKTCNDLGNVVSSAGRADEAEGWCRRALDIAERLADDPALANSLSNLAALLLDEVQAGRAPAARLDEARAHAERALAIREKLDLSSAPWTTLGILSSIAELQGQGDTAKEYRHRERETFAAFAGNRQHIDTQWDTLIADIAAAHRGDAEARAGVEAALPELEAKGWRIAAAVRRIWAGERDWHALSEGIDRGSALLVLRVLETLAES